MTYEEYCYWLFQQHLIDYGDHINTWDWVV